MHFLKFTTLPCFRENFAYTYTKLNETFPKFFQMDEWDSFRSFLKSMADTYNNHAYQIKLKLDEAKRMRWQSQCQNASDEYKTMTLNELHSIAPLFNWTKYVNLQLPTDVEEVNFDKQTVSYRAM